MRIWVDPHEYVDVPDTLWYSEKLYKSSLNWHYDWGFVIGESGMLHCAYLTKDRAKGRMHNFLVAEGERRTRTK